MKEMSSPEFVDKRKKGPVMIGTVMPSGEWEWVASSCSGLSIAC